MSWRDKGRGSPAGPAEGNEIREMWRDLFAGDAPGFGISGTPLRVARHAACGSKLAGLWASRVLNRPPWLMYFRCPRTPERARSAGHASAWEGGFCFLEAHDSGQFAEATSWCPRCRAEVTLPAGLWTTRRRTVTV